MLGGSVSKTGNYFAIELHVIDVETGAIQPVTSVDIEGNIGKILTHGLMDAAQQIIANNGV